MEHFRGAESELPDSKDSEDSLMEDEDEHDASNDSLSGQHDVIIQIKYYYLTLVNYNN